MVDFSDYPSKAGDWLLIRPGQVMRYDFSRPWSGWLLVFLPEQLTSAGRNHPNTAHGVMKRVEDMGCLHSLDGHQQSWMERSLQQMQQDIALQTDVLLRNDMLRLQLSSTLLRLSLWQVPDAALPQMNEAVLAKFKRFRQKLEHDFATYHQVQHYANALGMSEKSLSRACIAATGMPAKAYIGQRLVLESKRLLAHTSKHVQTISYELGFDDATNFVKFFRRATGMTPVAFRKGNLRAGQ